jgi:hypothetical protein
MSKKKKPSSRKPKVSKSDSVPEKAGGDVDATDPWVTCVTYDFHVNTAVDFAFVFEATDAAGAIHSLELKNEKDNPSLGQDLFNALQIWSKSNIQFKSEPIPGVQRRKITAVKRLTDRSKEK